MKLFVGNLPSTISGRDLEALFGQYGGVRSATIIMDSSTKLSRGFGFVEMETDEGAAEAMQALHGTMIQGRSMKIDYARND